MVSNRMKKDLAIRALDMAVALRQPPEGCIYYPAGDYKVICREGIIRIVIRWSSVIGSLTQIRFDRLMIGAAWLSGVV